MKTSFSCNFLSIRQLEFSYILPYTRSVFLLLVMSMVVSSATAQDLDPNLPPGGNFDLSYWKLTRPNQQERDAEQLVGGYEVDGEFYTDPVTGAMVFWCPNDGATGGSSYPRNELREMIRRLDTSIPTQGINKNNWVFSSSTMENQEAAGGVDGIMTATVAVDHVSETSDASFKVGRTIVGQIHASNDEPCRLYYRKLPGNTKGAIYFAHEPTTGPEQWYEMIGSRSDGVPDPVDGIALGEQFSYEIKVIGNLLTVTIMREGMDDVVQEVDMTDSGFADDWMYFKAGNYNQNNAGDPDEYAQVSFFALDVTHFAPTPPTAYLAPSDIPRFQPFLAECKLQGPTSSTLRDRDALNSGYTHPEWFYVVDGDKIRFNQSGDSQRTELRNETNWDLNDENRSLHGRIDIVEQTCDQVTVMQIHDDANAGSGPNKPLLRIYKHNNKVPTNHLWAAIKTDDGGSNTTHVDLGEDPGGYFNCDIRLVDGNMIIDFEGEEKVNMDVSYWTWPSYWKAGVYLQDAGEATAHFDELFEEDGSPQNYSPSVSITDPANGTNFLPGSDITITVDAVDSDGSVTAVEFIEGGGNILGEDTTAPYSFTWTNVPEGAYTLTARATDNEGGSKTSLSTNITVQVPIDVTGVDMAELTGPIAVGANLQLETLVSPGDATNQNLIFESDDTSVATVTESGLLSAISEGEVTITVTTVAGGFTDSQTLDVLTPSDDFNWALGQPVVGTGTPDGNNDEDKLVDDDTGTRWAVSGFPQSATVDLEGNIKITQTEVTCYQDRAYQFIIEGALNEDGPFTTIIDRSNNNIPGTAIAPIINAVDSIEARFVRITVSGADIYTGPWVSLTELRVFGDGERTFTNVTELEEEKIQISPNPASSIVTIEAGDEYDAVVVYDATGRSVIQKPINKLITLDISGLQSGTYFIKLEGRNKSEVRKLIKR
ncbi:polysaccharide lyase family 7 protein [Lewinella cohaerens]|uniref:polysaccharide lyase family 7 protein n=1 Tax=Lewinella cohaerens TaxID=70995 RepID=UPI000380F00D|nr:polysaccharide lyase family 7 protein [Lewinella cohaerens]